MDMISYSNHPQELLAVNLCARPWVKVGLGRGWLWNVDARVLIAYLALCTVRFSSVSGMGMEVGSKA
jgi:hypothetical protein